MVDEKDSWINKLEGEISSEKAKNSQLTTALATSNYPTQEGENLIQYQLDTSEMLSMIEHFLKGDYLTIDPEKGEIWATQTDKDLILLNNLGVNSLMLIISQYINKMTVLSFYDEMRINEILGDLGDALAYYVFNNYEKMGMDTEYKKSRYPITVIAILHSIESAYRRALKGRTSEDINSSKIFMQSDNIGLRSPTAPSTKKKFNLFKYSTW